MRVFLLIIAVLGLAAAGCGRGEDKYSGSLYTEPGPYPVGVTTLTLGDDFGNRLVEVWYPGEPGSEIGITLDSYTTFDMFPVGIQAMLPPELNLVVEMPAYRDIPVSTNAPFPVLTFSHGVGGFRLAYSNLLAGIASHGFVVASIDHLEWGLIAIALEIPPDSQFDADNLVLATLDMLEIESKTIGSRFEGWVDISMAASAGHSEGGRAAFALANRPEITTMIGYATDSAREIPFLECSFSQEGGPFIEGQVWWTESVVDYPCEVDSFDASDYSGNATNGGDMRLVRDPTDPSRLCLELELTWPGDRPLSSNQHTKVWDEADTGWAQDCQVEEAYYYGEVYIPEPFTYGCNIMQWGAWSGDDIKSMPMLALRLGNIDGEMWLRFNNKEWGGSNHNYTVDLTSIPTRMWIPIVVYIKESTDWTANDGRVKVWINGVLYHDSNTEGLGVHARNWKSENGKLLHGFVWSINNYADYREPQGRKILWRNVKVLSGKPVLLLVGSEDGDATRIEQSYNQLYPVKRFVSISKAGHNSFTDQCTIIYDNDNLIEALIESSFPIPKKISDLMSDGCLSENLSPLEFKKIVQHFTVAHLRSAFGIDDPPVGLEPEITKAFDDVEVLYRSND